MCGIIGQTSGTKESVVRGLDRMAHRGPDDRGILSEGDLTLAQCRLAIIDLAERSNQPMTSSSGKTTIVFNGEIYNYRTLRSELEQEGVRFRTEGDTEVLLEGYEKHGILFLEKLRGMWALAIHDERDGTILLSRDRFGIKPLYYSTEEGKLSFASEIGGIKTLLPKVTPNTEKYYQFFNLGYFIPPATYLKEVKKLRPAEVITWDLRMKEISSRFLAPIASQPSKSRSFADAAGYINEVLTDSVRAHFVSDVPVGLLLSGGNDSSLLAALAVAAGERPLLYNMAIEGSVDAVYAKKVADHLKLPLKSIPLSKDMLREQYDHIWSLLDEPTADPSILPTSLIFAAVKGNAKVVLSGEGGDEWFGGYLRHKQLISKDRIQEKDSLERIYSGCVGTSRIALQYLNPALNCIRNLVLDTFSNDTIGSYLKETKILDFPIAASAIRRDLYELYENTSGAIHAPKGLFFDRYSYLTNDLMHKTDAASMASSIEARVPFLDKEVESAVASIDPQFCLSEEYANKSIVKKILESYLPREIIYRPKTGFSFSFEEYDPERFRTDLAEALEFHRDHAHDFGLGEERLLKLCNSQYSDLIARKYPRFAFALISNWHCFKI